MGRTVGEHSDVKPGLMNIRDWRENYYDKEKGFKMKLYPGMEAEYEKRHNELWPEMQDMIHEYGGRNYTIFLDRETLILYGYIEIEKLRKMG